MWSIAVCAKKELR